MSNHKLTDAAIPALSAPANGDLLPAVDVSDTTDDPTGSTKSLLLSVLKTFILNNPALVGSVSGSGVDTDTTLAANSDTKLASQKAIKAYIDAAITNAAYFSSLLANGIINGSCVVAQRGVPNLSSAFQYGKVDRFAAKGAGTLVSAGTIDQSTSSNAGVSGYGLKLSGVTVTGTGEVYARYRMEAKDAAQFKNKTASFSVSVYHDVGSTITYTITVRKANAADDFSSVTSIGNNGGTSVSTITKTTIKYENISLGSCANGIEIEIKVSCGAVTTKSFEFADFQFNAGATANVFQPRPYGDVLRLCRRYCRKIGDSNSHQIDFNASSQFMFVDHFDLPMRVTPSLISTWLGTYNTGLGSSQFCFYHNNSGANITWSVSPSTFASDISGDSFISIYNSNGTTPSLGTAGVLYTMRFGSGSYFILDAEL
jgi:hypothetical protein